MIQKLFLMWSFKRKFGHSDLMLFKTRKNL